MERQPASEHAGGSDWSMQCSSGRAGECRHSSTQAHNAQRLHALISTRSFHLHLFIPRSTQSLQMCLGNGGFIFVTD